MLEKDALETYHVGYQQISASWQPHVFGEVFYLVKKKKGIFYYINIHTLLLTSRRKCDFSGKMNFLLRQFPIRPQKNKYAMSQIH